MRLKSALLLIFVVTFVQCQQDNTPTTSQPRIAPWLQVCYRNRNLFERDNRLPMTPNILIEILRKIEDSPDYTLNLQQFVSSLVHRFKQDGIVPANIGGNINDDILQYSTSGFNFHAHRLLLRSLIPGNANLFPVGRLTQQEQCTLHFMLSGSVELQARGDENERCSQLAQYRSIRVPRDTENFDMNKTPEMDKVKRRMHAKFGRYQVEDDTAAEDETDEPVEAADENIEEDGEGEINEAEDQTVITIPSNAVSQCPVENGVLQSNFGAFSVGNTINGIAAGLQTQQVTVRDVLNPLNLGNFAQEYRMARQQQDTLRVDNRFAATLTGDIAEAILIQTPTANVRVGASGAWNNTAIPNWYFLTQRENLQMTDAEIRGGIDGLVLGMNIVEWRRQVQTLRLSQILDMYYSQRGMFGSQNPETSIRACNRRNLYPTVAPQNQLREQSIAFTTALDAEMQTSVTLTINSTTRLSQQAVDNLHSYITNSLNDVACADGTDNVIPRSSSEVIIFVDTNWAFRDIISMIGHLLNNLDVGRFGSSYTILNANDGQIIVNRTDQLSDLYLNWTQAIHNNQPLGFNLPNIMRELRNITTNLMNSERNEPSVGGRSLIALLIPSAQGNVNEEHTNFALQQLQLFREDVPDLRFIFWAGGAVGNAARFERFVRAPERDLLPLTINLRGIGTDSIHAVALPMITRIQQEPRRIINHRCGADWTSDGQPGTTTTIQYIEPRGIAFYRLHPNYFFHAGGDRRLRIHGAGFAPITVCHSRRIERPRANMTSSEQSDVTCRVVNQDTVEIDLSNACGGHGMIHHCDPVFVSVEGPRLSTEGFRCFDRECRFPDQARFEIMGDNLGCFSSAQSVIMSFAMFFITIFTVLLQ